MYDVAKIQNHKIVPLQLWSLWQASRVWLWLSSSIINDRKNISFNIQQFYTGTNVRIRLNEKRKWAIKFSRAHACASNTPAENGFANMFLTQFELEKCCPNYSLQLHQYKSIDSWSYFLLLFNFPYFLKREEVSIFCVLCVRARMCVGCFHYTISFTYITGAQIWKFTSVCQKYKCHTHMNCQLEQTNKQTSNIKWKGNKRWKNGIKWDDELSENITTQIKWTFTDRKAVHFVHRANVVFMHANCN